MIRCFPNGTNRSLKTIFVVFLLSQFAGNHAISQGTHYWTQNFNEESSLLSGAVVGGGAGPSAIYYNPASIAESGQSSLSVNASLFSLHAMTAKNGLGEDINLTSTKFNVQPRFISYNHLPRKQPKLSLEFVILNNQIFEATFDNSVSYNIDILKSLPGTERYIASFVYNNYYREDWFGLGGSWQMNDHFYFGASMFVKIKSFNYGYLTDIQAYPLQDTIESGGTQIPFYAAIYTDYQYLKFNNYRLVWKFGLLYMKNKISFGFTITPPSLNVASDGKRVSKKNQQNNITNPDGDGFLPDLLIVDFQQQKDMSVNFKDPLSIAAGIVFKTDDNKSALYTTIEFFFPVNEYKIVQVDANPEVSNIQTYNQLPAKEYLSYAFGNHWILNAAIGYHWYAKDNLKFLGGFRTDFNYQNKVDYHKYSEYNKFKQIDLDIYHVTGGVQLTIKGQDLLVGLQYSVGLKRDQPQIINFSDPVEYNTVEHAALQGTRQNTMRNVTNELGVFFGATFNFMGSKERGD